MTHTNKIGDLPRYSDTVWYNSKGIYNTLLLGLVQNSILVTYNSLYRNDFVVHIPHLPTLKMAKSGMFYFDMRHLIKSKYAHIVVNYLYSSIPQMKGKKK